MASLFQNLTGISNGSITYARDFTANNMQLISSGYTCPANKFAKILITGTTPNVGSTVVAPHSRITQWNAGSPSNTYIPALLLPGDSPSFLTPSPGGAGTVTINFKIIEFSTGSN